MKKIVFCAAFLFSCLIYKSTTAQIHISLGLNIRSQPEWGPVGFDHAEYYYLPDIDVYYDVPHHQFVYLQNNVWVHAAALPPRYANFDLYHSYKAVVNERNPWEHAADMRTRFAGYKGRHDQVVIRDVHIKKYANHWKGDNGHDDHK